jgi:uncharacterized protein (DUF169 family)
MIQTKKIGQDFKQALKMDYSPVGFYFADKKPEAAIGFKKSGHGCIMPLIFASARGKTVAFDKNSTGWACSAFYLGYTNWIFPGIEHFLSQGPWGGRTCERFVKTPELARSYVESLKPSQKTTGVAIFKPLEKFSNSEKPELVIFFANPDQLSALVYLLYFDAPEAEDRVVTRFASACGSVVTLPLQYARRGEKKAVWGGHDISARARLPKELMSFTLPFDLLVDMWKNINESFLRTGQWAKIAQRFQKNSYTQGEV